MAIRKIHKRQLPVISQSSTTTTSQSSVSTGRGGVQPPTGPPMFITTTTTSSASASQATTSSSASSSSSSSSSSASPSPSISNTPTSTSETTIPTTPPAAATTRSVEVDQPPILTRQTTTRIVSSSTSSSTVSPTTSAVSDDTGMGLGSIAGIAVAGIIAIGVLTAFVIWLIKRRNKNRDIDEEPFNRNSFLRNSTAIPDDDDDAPLPGTRSRPAPAMSERTPTPLYGQPNASFGVAGIGSQAHDGFGYATQPTYGTAPGGIYSPNPFGPGGAPASPLPHSPGYGTTYDQGYNQGPGGYAELTRGGMQDYPPSPHLDNPHSSGYNGPDHSGGYPTPPPAAVGGQNGVVRSMTPVGQGQVVSVQHSEHDGRETPVQLGFAPAQQHQPYNGQAQNTNGKARPETVYDTEDAYGGI